MRGYGSLGHANRKRPVLALIAVISAASCSGDSTRPAARTSPPPVSRAIVSSPISSGGSGSSRTIDNAAGEETPDSVVYVSMQPGTAPNAVSISIGVSGKSSAVTTPIVDGGFDPVAVSAQAGDTLVLITHDANGIAQQSIAVVSTLRAPTVVRTSPASGRTDVPLSTSIVVVFDEPLDSASVANGVTLQLNGTSVPASYAFQPNGSHPLQVELQPLTALAAGAVYDIVITQSLVNGAGVALSAPITVPFFTAVGAVSTGEGLTIDSFEMREFQRADSTTYYYAPRLTVTETSGVSDVHVTKYQFVGMSDFPAPPVGTWCSTIDVLPGQTTQVFQFFEDGDFALVFWWPGHRAAPGFAVGKLTFRGADNVEHTVTVSGPIVSGSARGTVTTDVGWTEC